MSTVELVVIIVLADIIFIYALITFIRAIIIRSKAYKIAIDAIEHNRQVLDIVDRIDGYGYMPIGTFSVMNGYGYAYWRIKIKGYNRNVFVRIQLTRYMKEDWAVDKLIVQGSDGEAY